MTFRILTLAVVAAVAACKKSGNAVFTDVVLPCVDGDQMRNVLFFSFSNNIGPGAVWRKSKEGRYILVRQFDSTLPGAAGVIAKGSEASCSATSDTKKSVALDIGVKNLLAVMPVGFTPEFKRARSVEVPVLTWRSDQVVEGNFQDMLSAIANQDPTNGYLRDVRNVRLIAGRAIWVDSIVALITFDDSAVASLHATYPSGVSVTGKLDGSWQNRTSLREVMRQPAYVGIEFYQWRPEGMSAHNLFPDARKKRAYRHRVA